MSKLLLNSLEIRGFRAFRHLQIERLGRVNLIVGKNNVGKSCLLEALWLYARRGAPALIQDLLVARDEGAWTSGRYGDVPIDPSVRHLFHGRKAISEHPQPPIRIGPLDAPEHTLVITVGWYVEQADASGGRLLTLVEANETAANSMGGRLIPTLIVQVGTQRRITIPLDRDLQARWWTPEVEEIQHVFVPADSLDKQQIGYLWDQVQLRPDLEQQVVGALRIIAPSVEDVGLIGDQKQNRERIPHVRIAGLDDRIPLRSLGEGMNRLLGLALALVNAQDGLLLIDEVDSGLHYSVQPEMWRLIFQTAQRLNVQVFATTHNWDCIAAFQQAAQDAPADGLLISLRQKQDSPEDVAAILFDEQELAVATRAQIEVR